MPIDSQHKEYKAYQEKWTTARDASAGQYAIHAAGEKYLSKLSEKQTPAEYLAYKKRTSFFPATGRTVDGLLGMISRKDLTHDAKGIDNLIDDIDLSNNSLSSFAQTILREIITVDRVGVLVEYPTVNEANQSRSLAEQQQRNERPYATIYKTENIINWELARINNKVQPIMIILKELHEEQGDDAYTKKHTEQYRELRLIDGVYVQKIWRKVGDTDKYIQVGVDIVPKIKAKPLDFIPFYPFGSDENSLNISDAPILPLAELNIQHYKVNAGYENITYRHGHPTAIFSGFEVKDNEKVELGGAVVSQLPEAHAEYLEIQDSQMTERNLERKEKQMASIGARFLESQKAGVEAENTVKLRSSGENSVLAGIAKLASDQLSNMLTFMATWADSKQDITAKLNTDFIPITMSAQELTALVGSWQAGAISKQTLFNNLREGEIISEGTDFEDEEENIRNQEPNLATQ